jgi:multidrug efflux pump subunit AcrB
MLAAQLGKVRFKSGLDRFPPLRGLRPRFNALTDWLSRAAPRSPCAGAGSCSVAPWRAVGSRLRGTRIPNEFLPQVDDGTVGAFIRLPPGATPSRRIASRRRSRHGHAQMPHVESVFATAGGFLFGGEHRQHPDALVSTFIRRVGRTSAT